MRSQRFGIEMEMTGISRATAAKILAGYFQTTANYVGGIYDAYEVKDFSNRSWKIVSDASIRAENTVGESASDRNKVEVVSPICVYDDIPTIQQIVRELRTKGARVNNTCGIHVHVDAAPHTAQSLRNLVNIMAAKEDILYKALQDIKPS